MSAPALVRLGCRACGGPLPASVSWPCVLDCPSCGTPLVVTSEDTLPRSVVEPSVTLGAAVQTALASWRHALAPPGFPGRPESPSLVFIACFEVERCMVAPGRAFATETRSRTLAVLPSGLGVERLDLEAALDGERRTYDPRDVQSRGLVFDPVRSLAIALPVPQGLESIEERVEIVFVPLWVVRCLYRGQRYEAVVDATTGRLLRSRAPVERTARLGTAVLILFPIAALAGLPPAEWRALGQIAIRMPPLLTAWLVGLLALLLGWAWDRVRYRFEWIAGPEGGRLHPINRPHATWFERVAKFLLRMPRTVKSMRRDA